MHHLVEKQQLALRRVNLKLGKNAESQVKDSDAFQLMVVIPSMGELYGRGFDSLRLHHLGTLAGWTI